MIFARFRNNGLIFCRREKVMKIQRSGLFKLVMSGTGIIMAARRQHRKTFPEERWIAVRQQTSGKADEFVRTQSCTLP
jgi:hypothetical protein